MKKKYFLRGLGTGILFSAVILMLSNSNAKQMTDEEIRARALELGMVEKKSALDVVLKNKEKKESETATEGAIDQVTEEEGTNTSDVTDAPKKTEQPKNTATAAPVEKSTAKPEATQAPKATAKSTTAPVKATAAPKATKKPETQTSTSSVNLEIKAGMWSDEIAQTLQSMDVIDDAEAFDEFLCDQGYASDIRVGNYRIPKGASYEEVAEIITK